MRREQIFAWALALCLLLPVAALAQEGVISDDTVQQIGDVQLLLVSFTQEDATAVLRVKMGIKGADVTPGWTESAASYTITEPPAEAERTMLPHGYLLLSGGEEVIFDLYEAKFYGNLDFSQGELTLTLPAGETVSQITFVMRTTEETATYDVDAGGWLTPEAE